MRPCELRGIGPSPVPFLLTENNVHEFLCEYVVGIKNDDPFVRGKLYCAFLVPVAIEVMFVARNLHLVDSIELPYDGLINVHRAAIIAYDYLAYPIIIDDLFKRFEK